MLRKLRLFGAGLFVLGAITFAATQAVTPVEAQTGYGCCVFKTGDCPGGMKCIGPPTNCPPQNPPYAGVCKVDNGTPGPEQPTPAPAPGPLP